MTILLADPIFWYGLALKIAMTASIVVAASVVVERSGPFVGALIAALPTAGGAAMIILAIEHPPAFIAASAVGSMVANALGAVFALT
jgi:energy-converting hydrogenase Eha subunit E